ncbi:MAG: hypothetical protein ABIE22_05585 [archaeon]
MQTMINIHADPEIFKHYETENGRIKSCTQLTPSLEAQRNELRVAIDTHKWYRSKAVGNDIGWTTAQQEFLDCYFDQFAADFRANYCNSVCIERDRCDAKKLQFRVG